MDILLKMKEVQFWLQQVNSTSKTDYYFNKAQNELQQLIVDGERQQHDKIQAEYAEADARRGDPLGH